MNSPALVPVGFTYEFHVTAHVESTVELALKPESSGPGRLQYVIAALVCLLLSMQAISRLVRRDVNDRRILRAVGAGPRELLLETLVGVIASVMAGILLALRRRAGALAPGPTRPGATRLSGPRCFLRRDRARGGCPRLTCGARRVLGRGRALQRRAPRPRRQLKANPLGGGTATALAVTSHSSHARSALCTRASWKQRRRPRALGALRLHPRGGADGHDPDLRQRAQHPGLAARPLWLELELCAEPHQRRSPPAPLRVLITTTMSPPGVVRTTPMSRSMASPCQYSSLQRRPRSCPPYSADTVWKRTLRSCSAIRPWPYSTATSVRPSPSHTARPRTHPSTSTPTTLTIVGTATFPAVGYATSVADHTSMGTGALLPLGVEPPSFVRAISSKDPNLNGPAVVFVRLRTGVSARRRTSQPRARRGRGERDLRS